MINPKNSFIETNDRTYVQKKFPFHPSESDGADAGMIMGRESNVFRNS
jgi:hypothetical protein